MLPDHCAVLIAGGGPCGLMLANELGRRGVTAILVDPKPTTAFNPQANATQARTMEYFRRLGFADEIRSLGLPPEFPTDIAYFTRFATYEIGRFKLPSAQQAKSAVATLSGSWSAAELPHRVSQKYVEAVLRRHAEALPGITVRYGWRLVQFADEGDGVRAVVENVADGARHRIRAAFLVGADGPRSFVRDRLGFEYAGATGVRRDFMGGLMYAVYLQAPGFYEVVPHPPAWMNVTFNPNRRAFMAAVDGKGEFAFHTQLLAHETPDAMTDRDAADLFRAAVGAPIDAKILSRGTWTAGHALVADRFQSGRVLLGGDAVHLFTPTGGLGYNTAVEDAVNLGWKLAAVVSGVGGPRLLESYEVERRAVALRNTGFARAFADSLGLFVPVPEIEDATAEGERARREAGAYLESHAKAEFNIPGVTFGARYDGSPVIASDGTAPPADGANSYTPSACPGGRAPHAWLRDGRSLYDMFGLEWTLLRLRRNAPAAGRIREAAATAGLAINVVDPPDADISQLRDLYEADLAIVRPDQVVAWRGDDVPKAHQLVGQLIGAEPRA